MLTSHVQKIARVLNILVLIALVCNLILLFFVPVAVRSDQPGLLLGTGDYLSGVLFPGEDDISAAGAAASWLSWFWIFRIKSLLSNFYYTIIHIVNHIDNIILIISNPYWLIIYFQLISI